MLCQIKNRRLGMLDDLTNLQALLKDSTLLATRGYMAGEWCDGENCQIARAVGFLSSFQNAKITYFLLSAGFGHGFRQA